MRKFLPLVLLVLALPLFAQMAPPGPQPSQSSVGFWAAGQTSYVAATTSSQQIQLSVVSNQVQIYNASTTAVAFVAFGTATGVTASVGTSGTSTSDYPVAPGALVVVTVPLNTRYAAVILSSSTGSVYLTPGQGL